MLPETPEYQRNDCAVIVVSNLAGCSYNEAVEALRFFGRKDDDGAHDFVILHALTALGHKHREYVVRPAKTTLTLTRWWNEGKNWRLRGPFNLMVTTHDHVYCHIGINKLDISFIPQRSRVESVWLVNKRKWEKRPEKHLTSIKCNV